jgi:hypothetical protein
VPPPRLRPPPALSQIARSDPYERALHAYGRSYGDIVRAFRGCFEHPPDVVLHPRGEEELDPSSAAEADFCPRAAVKSLLSAISMVRGRENA